MTGLVKIYQIFDSIFFKHLGLTLQDYKHLELECGPTQSNLFIYWITVLRYSSDLSTIIVVSSAKVSLLLSIVAKVMPLRFFV